MDVSPLAVGCYKAETIIYTVFVCIFKKNNNTKLYILNINESVANLFILLPYHTLPPIHIDL